MGFCVHCGFSLGRSAKTQSAGFCCYGCAFAHQILAGSPDGRQASWILVQLGAAAFLAMNVMGFSLAFHASSIYPDFYQHLSIPGRALDQLMRYLLFFMSAPVLMLVGAPLLTRVISEARGGRWGTDGFIATGVLAAFAYSMVSTLRGSGPVYFDVAVMVLLFVTLGRYMEAKFRSRAADSLKRLIQDDEPCAFRIEAEEEVRVPSAALKAGDVVMVRAGQKIAADGEILEGSAVVEMAAMTGEAIPVHKRPGDAVWSGAVLSEGYLRIRVTHPARESWAARLQETLEQAKRSKSAAEKTAETIVAAATWVMLACALAALVLGWKQAGAMSGVMRALSVLVIVCPCALGAAIPLALWKSFEYLARRGVLFRDLGLLESLSRVRGVFFDKTGTLTESLPRLLRTEKLSGGSDAEVLGIAASLARVSAHPFSRAIAEAARPARIGTHGQELLEVQSFVGEGLSGRLPDKGEILLGSASFLERRGVQVAGCAKSGQGLGELWMSLDGFPAARFEFEERVRTAAAEAVRRLKESGYETAILTGDESRRADAVGRALGMPVVPGLSPEAKLEWVRRWEEKHGPALVVGEGLNDAPMLAGSGVSLAMGGALARTRAAADFCLPDDDLGRIPELLTVARRTMNRIRVNLFWAFFYNCLAVPLAIAGWIHPIIAAAAMIVSSVSVLLHSLKSERMAHES